MLNISKVLIATGIFPPDIGGPAAMLESLSKSLIEHGFEIKIITYSDRADNQRARQCFKTQHNSEQKSEVFRIKKKLPFGLSQFRYYFKLCKLAKWADLIYATDTYSVGFFAYLIKKRFHKKYILRFTGDSAWEISRTKGWTKDYILDFQNKVYNKKIEKLKQRRNKIMFNADKIIVDCKFNKNLAEKIGVSKEKIQIIYNSVDFMDMTKINQDKIQEIRNRYGKNNTKIIITACRLTQWKGIDKIIQILPELKNKVGNFNFLILGNGQVGLNFKTKQDPAIQGNVHFLGKIKKQDILNYFKSADVFVLNSQYEGLSHTLLEVMKIGTPIVTTNVGGNPELIENNKNGVLVEYNNEKELLKGLEKILLDNEFTKKIVENGKEKVKKFRWGDVISKTIEVIYQ